MRIAGRLGTRRARQGAAVVAAAVALGGGLAACTASASPVQLADGFGAGDGLGRFVVTLVAEGSAALSDPVLPGLSSATTAAVPTAAPSDEATVADPSTIAGVRGRLDVGLLAQAHTALGVGGQVIAYGTGPYYVVDGRAVLVGPGGDGSVVDLAALAAALGSSGADAGATATAADADDAGAEGGPRAGSAPGDPLATLAARPGVASAQRLADGTVLVATGLTQDELAAFPEVAGVTPSTEVPVLGQVVPDDPYLRTYGWNLHNTGSNAYQQTATAGADVDALTAWTVTQGQGAVVAVVDTGFDSDHPDLAGSLWTNPAEACGAVDTNGNGKAGDCHGWNFYANSADVDNGALGSHGTSVSGVIGARANNGQGSAGVAPQVQLMPLVVGGGESVDVYLAAEAIRYAADNGADVVNASFGGSFGGAALDNLRAAVDYAIGKGVVVVAAAGNDAANRDASKVYPASLENPALLTVASTTASDRLSSFSAYGASSVDLGAPGELVVTPWNDGGYRVVSGTSTAAPHVAAAAALHLSLRDLTPAEVRSALLADAEPVAALAGRTVSGGRLSVGPLASGADRIGYTFSGMVAAPGQQRPVVEIASTAPAGTYAVTFGLAILVDGEVWAVSGEDVTFAGALATTDDAGTATFSLGALPGLGTRTLEPVLSLGEGDFALTVQVLRDGEPLTRPYAAPLVVTAAAGPGAGGDSEPGTQPGTDPATGGGTDPGTGGGTDPGTGGGVQPGGGTTPGTGPGGTDPGTGGDSPLPGTGGSTQPGTGGSTPPGGGGSVTPGGGTSPGGTDPGTGGTDPGVFPGAGGGTSPGGTDPGTGGSGSEPPTGGTPSNPDVARYDHVGAFGITYLSPVHVPASGGSLVAVRGDAIEPGVSVRVGATATADVVLSTSTLLVFVTPPRVPGTYDVTISRSGRTSVLVDALVYLAPGESGSGGSGGSGGSTQPGTQPGTGGGDPSTGGSTSPGTGGSTQPGTGGGTTPGGSTDPGTGGGTTPGGTSPGTGPGAGDSGSGGDGGGGDGGGGDGGGTTPQAPRTSRTGPNGEHLVRNDALAALAGLWSRQCTTSCAGVQV